MLQEVFELLQSSGGDVDTFVTDLSAYKLIQILTVHLPFLTATFLLSQEYLGEKIACFPPDDLHENHASALNAYCWNHGMWIANNTVTKEPGLATQPHRFYPLYLPLQAVLFLLPIILWNILTKPHLLATLRGTEEFLDNLLEVVTNSSSEHAKKKAIRLIQQFHLSCVAAAESSSLALIASLRVISEHLILIASIYMQFSIYNPGIKSYQCDITELAENDVQCSVPIFDLFDGIWAVNFLSLVICLIINIIFLVRFYFAHYSNFQPLFYNNLPFGDEDDFNENVCWTDRWTKHSYILLMKIFNENPAILTRVYILSAMQPDERKQGWKQRLAAKKGGKKLTQYQRSIKNLQKQGQSPPESTESHLQKVQEGATKTMIGDKAEVEKSPSHMLKDFPCATKNIHTSDPRLDKLQLHTTVQTDTANQEQALKMAAESTNQESDAEREATNRSADEVLEDSDPEGHSADVPSSGTKQIAENLPIGVKRCSHGDPVTAAAKTTFERILRRRSSEKSDFPFKTKTDGEANIPQTEGDSDITSAVPYFRSESEHLTAVKECQDDKKMRDDAECISKTADEAELDEVSKLEIINDEGCTKDGYQSESSDEETEERAGPDDQDIKKESEPSICENGSCGSNSDVVVVAEDSSNLNLRQTDIQTDQKEFHDGVNDYAVADQEISVSDTMQDLSTPPSDIMNGPIS